MVKVAIPDVEQAQPHRQVLRQRSRFEVLVHLVRTGQQRAKAGAADGNCNRQTNRRPQRITPTHPVPKAEGGGDAELLRRCHVGRQRGEMARGVSAALRLKPSLGRARVGHGLCGGEGFRGDQKQRAAGLAVGQHAGEFLTIDVGDEMQLAAGRGEFSQRQHRHLRPQVRAANADVHHVGDGRVRAHVLGVGEHGLQGLRHIARPVRRSRRSRRRCPSSYLFRSFLRPSCMGKSRIS